MLRAIKNFNNPGKSESVEFFQECLETSVEDETFNVQNSFLKDIDYLSSVSESLTTDKHSLQTIINSAVHEQNGHPNGIDDLDRESNSSDLKDFICDDFKNEFTQYTNESIEPFKCFLCDAVSTNKVSLLEHLNTHSGIQSSCNICKQTFSCKKANWYHSKIGLCSTKLDSPRYECIECKRVFSNRRYFEKHMEGHKLNNCTYCSAKFTHRKHLMNHLLHVHQIKENACFQCPFCNQKYVKKRSLNMHIFKNHANGKFPCAECGELFENKLNYDEHSLKHAKEKQFQCDRCGEKFIRRQQYLVHIQQHDKYECITCKETFASKQRALEHKQKGHRVDGLEPQLTCPNCQLAFNKKSTLQKHLLKHQVKLEFSCKQCDKIFSNESRYINHLNSFAHEDYNYSEKYFCEICKKQFKKRAILLQHLIRSHRNANVEYSCELCEHRCNNKTNLERHMQLHLKHNKEFVCDQCGKAFYNMSSLKDHQIYVHSEHAQFECIKCGKCFKRKSELIRHQMSHSEIRPHVCSKCGQSYKRNTHLKRHQQSSHGIKSPIRSVQRLIKNINGELVPVPKPQKQTKNIISSKTTEEIVVKDNLIEPIYSLMDVNSGELVTLSVSELQDVAVVSKTLPPVLNLMDGQFPTDMLQPLEIPYQELWSDKNLPQLTDEYINSGQIQSLIDSSNLENQNNVENSVINSQESFTVCQISDNYLNQTNIPLDHIDTTDLIVLPSDVNGDLSSTIQKDDGTLSLPDYLQHPFQYM